MEIETIAENKRDLKPSSSSQISDDHHNNTNCNCSAFSEIINNLAENEKLPLKSQQRNEEDITKQEKMTILTDIFNKSKSNFLSRFGQFLTAEQISYFEQFKDDPKDGYEIVFHLRNISKMDSQKKKHRFLRNKRYAALKRLEKEQYFSETEMMKRNPLLYEQLVGQYLSTKEKRLRDRRNYIESKTFVGVLMDGIEKEHIDKKRKEQEAAEDAQMEESDDDDDEDDDKSEEESCTTKSKPEEKTRMMLWGEMEEDGPQFVRAEPKNKDRFISGQERKILREEFVSLMYQNFLDGKDEEFDYETVDNNEEYDNLEILDHDEEERYFDSEEPDDMIMDDSKSCEINKIEEEEEDSSSEDELDMYMNALNQHPSVCQLSEDIKKL